MTHELVEILQENLGIAARMHHHLERSHQQIADGIPLQAGQVSQLSDEQIDRLDLYLWPGFARNSYEG